MRTNNNVSCNRCLFSIETRNWSARRHHIQPNQFNMDCARNSYDRMESVCRAIRLASENRICVNAMCATCIQLDRNNNHHLLRRSVGSNIHDVNAYFYRTHFTSATIQKQHNKKRARLSRNRRMKRRIKKNRDEPSLFTAEFVCVCHRMGASQTNNVIYIRKQKKCENKKEEYSSIDCEAIITILWYGVK